MNLVLAEAERSLKTAMEGNNIIGLHKCIEKSKKPSFIDGFFVPVILKIVLDSYKEFNSLNSFYLSILKQITPVHPINLSLINRFFTLLSLKFTLSKFQTILL